VITIIDKSEKYLKSIDNTLSDILKELKRQARLKETTSITLNVEDVKDIQDVVKCFERLPTSEYL
jgi:hypothetical protein